MRSHQYYVYIATNRRGTLYTGVSNDCERRMAEHSTATSGFTARYRINRLVYVEWTTDVWSAIEREKQIKGWTRERKLALIRRMNPALRELLYQPTGRRIKKPPMLRRGQGVVLDGPGHSSRSERPV
ncbi:MAG: GIY-YIG nuclease family protein [Thermomicrobiales bacterium]